ncbi:GNAT family N-acetyltransferase [Candidatus Poribacteria bacterium]|nr:GNAT family N-acetyltransferase [Candidatus Poribacteria bacterium]
MKIQIATCADIPSWLELASEVEFLFGPMVDQPDFHSALYKNIDRESAYCVREQDRSAGAPLMGGLFLSSRPPEYHIRWLSVAEQWRRGGIGTVLLEHVFGLINPPAELFVTTFGEDNPEGQPARHFYKKMGFESFAEAPLGPEGGSREIFRKSFPIQRK